MGWPKDVANRRKDRLCDTARIFGHFSIPEPNDPPAELFEKQGTFSIIRRIDMLAAVKLDGQFRLSAGQIENVVSDNQLTRKARTVAVDQTPDCSFSVRCVVAELAGAIGHDGRNAGHREILTEEPAESNRPPTQRRVGHAPSMA